MKIHVPAFYNERLALVLLESAFKELPSAESEAGFEQKCGLPAPTTAMNGSSWDCGFARL